MSDREAAATVASGDAHVAAADAFVERATSRAESDVVDLYVFGSTVRGETRGLASDVDIMIVLDEEASRGATADALREIAYDVMLEYGPVVELHVLSESEFERARNQGNPFVRRVVEEGQVRA